MKALLGIITPVHGGEAFEGCNGRQTVNRTTRRHLTRKRKSPAAIMMEMPSASSSQGWHGLAHDLPRNEIKDMGRPLER